MVMKKLTQLSVIVLTLNTLIFAQGVSINTNGADADASAILDVSSTTQGFLPPRMTESQRIAISSPATGLLVFQTDATTGLYYYTGTQWQVISEQKPTYAVGDHALGGIVFYVNADGTHGLVCTAQDQSAEINWYDAHNNLKNPANHDTEGKKYFDWRLPSKYELELLYMQKETIGNFENAYYWSSTENYETGGSLRAWMKHFRDGELVAALKTDGDYVRAIRTF